MTYIIYIILYISIFQMEEITTNFPKTLWKLQVVIFFITPLKHEKNKDFFQESKS